MVRVKNLHLPLCASAPLREDYPDIKNPRNPRTLPFGWTFGPLVRVKFLALRSCNPELLAKILVLDN